VFRCVVHYSVYADIFAEGNSLTVGPSLSNSSTMSLIIHIQVTASEIRRVLVTLELLGDFERKLSRKFSFFSLNPFEVHGR
jgi:hypothetical protein